MSDNETRWWILQVELPERYPDQNSLFSEPMPRAELLRKALALIPTSIRIQRHGKIWGLADLAYIDKEVIVAKLMVRPPDGSVAEEQQPGVLSNVGEPRVYTHIVVHISRQIIVVRRAPELFRFAHSANSFAEVFYFLLEDAIQKVDINQFQHYILSVEPIAKTGSFAEWHNSLDSLNKIIVHYVGPNLPSSPNSFVDNIRETAKAYRNQLRSESVDLVAIEPNLEKSEVEELDRAVAERKLRMRAKGTRLGVITHWSSKDKPEPETARVPLAEEELAQPNVAARKIAAYIEDRFGE